MTSTSPRLVCRILSVALVVGQASLPGCASLGPVRSVAVSDIKSVSGTWKGIVYLPGSERNDVTVTIRDDGSYETVSVKPLGVSYGTGYILIRDGHLIIEGERGRGIGTVLQNSAGDVVMKVEMTLFDNSYLSAELVRVSDPAGFSDRTSYPIKQYKESFKFCRDDVLLGGASSRKSCFASYEAGVEVESCAVG